MFEIAGVTASEANGVLFSGGQLEELKLER